MPTYLKIDNLKHNNDYLCTTNINGKVIRFPYYKLITNNGESLVEVKLRLVKLPDTLEIELMDQIFTVDKHDVKITNNELPANNVQSDEIYESGTGSVRSKDIIGYRYDLISGFALGKLAETYLLKPHFYTDNFNCHMGFATLHLYDFLGGNGGEKLLQGWFHLCEAIVLLDDPSCRRTGNGWAKIPHAAMKRLAATCQEGAIKYGDHNWLYGFQVTSLCNNTAKHLFQFNSGNTEEDHLGHSMWGFMSAVHMYFLRPDMHIGLLGPEWSLTEANKKELEQHKTRRTTK